MGKEIKKERDRDQHINLVPHQVCSALMECVHPAYIQHMYSICTAFSHNHTFCTRQLNYYLKLTITVVVVVEAVASVVAEVSVTMISYKTVSP